MWYIYTIEYYSTVKKSEVLKLPEKKGEVTNYIEVTPTQKRITCPPSYADPSLQCIWKLHKCAYIVEHLERRLGEALGGEDHDPGKKNTQQRT